MEAQWSNGKAKDLQSKDCSPGLCWARHSHPVVRMADTCEVTRSKYNDVCRFVTATYGKSHVRHVNVVHHIDVSEVCTLGCVRGRGDKLPMKIA